MWGGSITNTYTHSTHTSGEGRHSFVFTGTSLKLHLHPCSVGVTTVRHIQVAELFGCIIVNWKRRIADRLHRSGTSLLYGAGVFRDSIDIVLEVRRLLEPVVRANLTVVSHMSMVLSLSGHRHHAVGIGEGL